MRATRAIAGLPLGVRRALERLGRDLSAARRRRRLPMGLMAQRAFISRNTLARAERGDPGVSMGIYATVLFVLGMADGIGQLAAPAADRVGLGLEEDRLPRRVRTPRRGPATTHGGT